MLTKNEEKMIDLIESKFKINLRKATAQEVSALFQNGKFKSLFNEDNQNDFADLLSGIGKIIEEKDTRDVIIASQMIHSLILARSRIISYFDSYEDSAIGHEDLVASVQSEIDSDNEIAALNAILINYESNLNLKISSRKLVENLKKISRKLVDILTTKFTYYYKAILIDLVCEVLDRYFTDEGVKVCQENPDIWTWVKDEIHKLQEVEDKDFHRPSEFDIEEDSQLPEELGLLDITKLKKRGEDNED
jgi:hypothetical protein